MSPYLWCWPPLWPFLLVVTVVWALTHWMAWVILHLAVVIVITVALATQLATHSAPPPAGPPGMVVLVDVAAFGIPWVLVLGHISLYVWWRVRRASTRRARAAELAAASPSYQDYLAFQHWQQANN